MKKLLILFLSLFLFTTQANAFLGFGVAKYAYSKLPKKKQEQVKKVAKNILKPTPKPQAKGK